MLLQNKYTASIVHSIDTNSCLTQISALDGEALSSKYCRANGEYRHGYHDNQAWTLHTLHSVDVALGTSHPRAHFRE